MARVTPQTTMWNYLDDVALPAHYGGDDGASSGTGGRASVGAPDDGVEARRELRADCASCFGLCCVALGLTKSADFAIDKPAGEPCPHLQTDYGCGIHAELRPRGFPGCVAYDCFGAGQQVAQVTFGGRDWRTHPETATQMFDALSVMRQLHELLWYLADAMSRSAAERLRDELRAAKEAVERLTDLDPDDLLALDVGAQRDAVAPLLRQTSELVRAGTRPPPDRSGADLVGAKLRGADLRRADLRGAHLIGADLRDAKLRTADLIGADLRGARLDGADLGDALFVTQSQLGAATGDTATTLPAAVDRPAHWCT